MDHSHTESDAFMTAELTADERPLLLLRWKSAGWFEVGSHVERRRLMFIQEAMQEVVNVSRTRGPVDPSHPTNVDAALQTSWGRSRVNISEI